MSESMLSMVLDIEVDRHKRELAESFAAARARLIPPPKEKSQQDLWLDAMRQFNACGLMNSQNAQNNSPYNNYGMSQSVLEYSPFGLSAISAWSWF